LAGFRGLHRRPHIERRGIGLARRKGVTRKRAQPEPSGYTILVVDDEESARVSMRVVLEREGHAILVAESGQRALELFGQHPVHLLLVDYFMPKMTGEELIGRIREIDRDVQIVLQTGYAGEKPPREMLRRLDIQGYHDKTDGPDKLLLWVEVALKAYEHVRRVREAEILKSQLLANVSHELRTPLNVILGYLELLADDLADAPEAGERLARVRDNAETLHWLVEDLLRLAELDTSAAVSCAGTVDWAVLRDEVVCMGRQLVRDKPIRVAWEVPAGLPAIAADPSKLRVVLRNLLLNAVKFTDTGTITVSAAPAGTALALSIADTGIGIASEHHQRIFAAFHQVDGGSTRRHEGAGIGLTTARALTRLMGGDITVTSAPGQGTTFAVHLPIADAPAAPPPHAAPPEAGPPAAI
jgi:signal transduction histidine kinase